NTILGILLTWTIFGTLYETQCTATPLQVNIEDLTNVCDDHHGEIHDLNIPWITDDCEKCNCSEEGIECTSLIVRPIGYDEDNCREIFDDEFCIFIAVEKDNPSITCTYSYYA
uniref:Beta-microseminoprotein n=1 Tax=Monodelphis domestica TaxID=13616 RepID=F6T2R6_MONDO